MSMEQRDGNSHKMSQIVVNVVIVVTLVAYCRDIFCAVPFQPSFFWFSSSNYFAGKCQRIPKNDCQYWCEIQ